MYIALKSCKFGGKTYSKGSEIPDGVVLDTAAPHLIRRGVIAEAGNAGPLLPAAVSIEKDIPVKEEKAVPPSEDNTKFTESELMELTRTQLVEMATQLGMEVGEKDTKRILTAYILEVQAGSDE